MDVMPQLLQKPPDPPDINARTDPNIFISNVKEYYFIVYISAFNSHSNGKPLNGGEERCHLTFNKLAKCIILLTWSVLQWGWTFNFTRMVLSQQDASLASNHSR